MAERIKPRDQKAAPIPTAEITEELRLEREAALLEKDQFDVESARAEAEKYGVIGDADRDLETDLTELHEITGVIGQYGKGEGKKRYEELRGVAAAGLEDGSRYFLDERGQKWLAVRRQQRPLEVDHELLYDAIADNEELLDELMPRGFSIDAFRKAVRTGRISRDVLVQVSSIGEKAAYVQFYPAQ